MDRRFSTQDHDGLGSSMQGGCREGRQPADVQGVTGERVPTLSTGNAKGASQVAATQSDRERGNQFQFIRDLGLCGKNARCRPGMANAGGASRAINAALVGTEAAILERQPGSRNSLQGLIAPTGTKWNLAIRSLLESGR